MMNAELVLTNQRTYRTNSETRSCAIAAPTPTHAEELADAIAAERLTERFADLTWKTLMPVTMLSLTFAAGVLTCAQFLAVHM